MRYHNLTLKHFQSSRRRELFPFSHVNMKLKVRRPPGAGYEQCDAHKISPQSHNDTSRSGPEALQCHDRSSVRSIGSGPINSWRSCSVMICFHSFFIPIRLTGCSSHILRDQADEAELPLESTATMRPARCAYRSPRPLGRLGSFVWDG